MVVQLCIVEVVPEDRGLRRADAQSLLYRGQRSALGGGWGHHVDPVRARDHHLHAGHGRRQRVAALGLGVAEGVDGDLDDVVQREVEQIRDRFQSRVVEGALTNESFVNAVDIGAVPGGDHGSDVESPLPQGASRAHCGDGVRAGDGLAVDLGAALDDDRAVLRDHRAVGDRGAEDGPEIVELAARGRYEGDIVLAHACQDGAETGWKTPLDIEQGAIHIGDDQSEIHDVGKGVGRSGSGSGHASILPDPAHRAARGAGCGGTLVPCPTRPRFQTPPISSCAGTGSPGPGGPHRIRSCGSTTTPNGACRCATSAVSSSG